MSESEVLAESGEVEEEQVAHEVHDTEEELAEAGQNDAILKKLFASLELESNYNLHRFNLIKTRGSFY